MVGVLPLRIADYNYTIRIGSTPTILYFEYPSTFETTLKDKNTSQDALILDVFVVCYQIERDFFVERRHCNFKR